ncbi:hypothetical protein DUNSADRAFT_18186 [Dunaliella salina]|uniref:Uncharacterized protein n=1 Tax=Dunaliella salina TaxID=3046 RepID=A0ABQ7G0I7_DUNSA|nr:hypothetical protein DUNSADRAFT_18186 [Dunaliella salina]|eukprot:KAF5828116.1 hypothetical protein DUNSADRAFT_18186 [Dunaliella salina]
MAFLQDNLDKVPMTMSQVRGEDAQCMQQLEAFQRSLRGDVAFGDPLFRVASALGSWIWRSALLVVAGMRKIWPTRFPEDYVQQQVR